MARKPFDIMSVMSQQSVPDKQHAAREFVVEMIPLEQIEPNADNFYNTEDIVTLAEDILQNGLLHNVVICSRGENGLYKLISGERRYRAFELLKQQGNEGYDAIPATVDDEQDPLMIKLKLISANASARVLSDYEKTTQAAQITDIIRQLKQQGHELPGRVREITARALGVSTAQAGRFEKINNDLVPEVKEIFASGGIGVTEAYDVATLPPEQQLAAVEARAEKATEEKPSFVSQADIDAVLLRGGGYRGSKERLAVLYAKQPDAKDAVEALKEAWGSNWQGMTFASGESGTLQTSGKGITFGILGEVGKVTISWMVAHKRMLQLIAEGRFSVVPEESDEEDKEPAQAVQEVKPTAPAPKAAPQEVKREKATTWTEGLDGELAFTAATLENWKRISTAS